MDKKQLVYGRAVGELTVIGAYLMKLQSSSTTTVEDAAILSAHTRRFNTFLQNYIKLLGIELTDYMVDSEENKLAETFTEEER